MAARGVNKVILVGNLGADPEIRFAANGQGIASINIATSDSWQDKMTGEMREKTEWHRVVIFGKLAEIAGQYLKKGSQVYIEGQLQTRKWQDQSGAERYTTEVVVNQIGGVMQMLGGRNAAQPNEMGYANDYTQQNGIQNNHQAWGNSAQNSTRPAMQNKAQYQSQPQYQQAQQNQFNQHQGYTQNQVNKESSFESSAPIAPEPSVIVSDEDIPF